jgi:uncharacterized protein (TIGR00251 family)
VSTGWIVWYHRTVAIESSLFLRASKEGLILEVVVVPRAKRSKFVGFHGGYPKIALAAPPIEGRANEELVAFLKELLGLPGRNIELVRGDTSRRKAVILRGIAPEKVLQVLESSQAS